jgi:anti-sigma factor (TIGR02949 family)
MSCTQWQDRIQLYADGELPAGDRDAFRAHAQSCAACAAQALAAAEARLAVRDAGQRYEAPADLRARVARIARGEHGLAIAAVADRDYSPRRSAWFAMPRWATAAAAVLLVAAGILLVANQREQRQALAEFADLHVATLASANPVEVVSTDRHTVKPWFQSRIPFAFDLPELAGTPFTLIGGRVAYVQQQPAAQLLFGYQKHMISVFVLHDGAPAAGDEHASSFHVRSWRQNDLRYVVLGDASDGVIQQLSDLLQRAR